MEVLGTTGSRYFGSYAGTDARIVLDSGWTDEDCAYGEDFVAFIATVPAADEVTYDWYAQDDDENIWYLGADTDSGGDRSGSFVAGCLGAQVGIVVLGAPSKGTSTRRSSTRAKPRTGARSRSSSRSMGLSA